MITGNKGEWSELYALFRILGDKKIYSGDGMLNRLDTFYPVIKIIRDELERHLEYSIEKDIVVLTEDNKEFIRINIPEFLEESEKLFHEIKTAHTSAFEIPSMEGFMQKIHCRKLKAKSSDKADIHIVIHDYHTGTEPNLGFSIKSAAGAKPTLLNASVATEFEYKIVGGKIDSEFEDRINNINGSRKIQDRVNAIYDNGCRLEFVKTGSPVLMNNLRMISDHLPEIVGWLMADSYLNRNMNIVQAVERIIAKNPLNYDLSFNHDFYGYKVKTLLTVSALGMLPATTWNGRYEATGGYLVVKSDGDIVCFHIYDRNMLEDYLYQNTKFETPTGGRYNLAKVYKNDDGDYYFNLVLQVRFIN